MLKLILDNSSKTTIILALVVLFGCGKNDEANWNKTSLKENGNSNSKQENNENQVDKFKIFAEKIFSETKKIVEEKKIEVKLPGRPKSMAKVEVDSDYKVDVKKSDSLISPYSGTITVKKRLVHINFHNNQDFRDPWESVTIKCLFQNGQWKVDK